MAKNRYGTQSFTADAETNAAILHEMRCMLVEEPGHKPVRSRAIRNLILRGARGGRLPKYYPKPYRPRALAVKKAAAPQPVEQQQAEPVAPPLAAKPAD